MASKDLFVGSYKGQKYSSIKKECLKKGQLFTDPEFPPNAKSLFYSKIDTEIEWKRPKVRELFEFFKLKGNKVNIKGQCKLI